MQIFGGGKPCGNAPAPAEFLRMKAIVVPQPRGKLCRRGSLLHFPLLLLLVSLTFGCPGPAQGAQFYTNWAAAHFGDIPAQSGPLDDPDGDLELNVVEFAFGTDPRVPDSTGSALTPRFSGEARVERSLQSLDNRRVQLGPRGEPTSGRSLRARSATGQCARVVARTLAPPPWG